MHHPPEPSRAGRLAGYRVVLHHDPEFGPLAVVRAVMEVTRVSRAEATHTMWQAHHRGNAVILTAHRERAELYQHLFGRRGLRVTLEAV